MALWKYLTALMDPGRPSNDSALIECKKMVRLAGLEPARDIIPLPPQGSASANSAIAARKVVIRNGFRSLRQGEK